MSVIPLCVIPPQEAYEVLIEFIKYVNATARIGSSVSNTYKKTYKHVWYKLAEIVSVELFMDKSVCRVLGKASSAYMAPTTFNPQNKRDYNLTKLGFNWIN